MKSSNVVLVAILTWSMIVPYGCRQRVSDGDNKSVIVADVEEAQLTAEQKKTLENGKAKMTELLNDGSIQLYSANGQKLEGDLRIASGVKSEDFIFVHVGQDQKLLFGVKASQSALEKASSKLTVELLDKDLKTSLAIKPFTLTKDSNTDAVRFKETITNLVRLIPETTANDGVRTIYGFLDQISNALIPVAYAGNGNTLSADDKMLASIRAIAGFVLLVFGALSVSTSSELSGAPKVAGYAFGIALIGAGLWIFGQAIAKDRSR